MCKEFYRNDNGHKRIVLLYGHYFHEGKRVIVTNSLTVDSLIADLGIAQARKWLERIVKEGPIARVYYNYR